MYDMIQEFNTDQKAQSVWSA